jgi:hypothetical protein
MSLPIGAKSRTRSPEDKTQADKAALANPEADFTPEDFDQADRLALATPVEDLINRLRAYTVKPIRDAITAVLVAETLLEMTPRAVALPVAVLVAVTR